MNSTSLAELSRHLLNRLAEVQRNLGMEPVTAEGGDVRFADAIDSMGLVEFVALVASDCGVAPTAVEDCVAHRFSTVSELAHALAAAGLRPVTEKAELPSGTLAAARRAEVLAGGAAVRLPEGRQTADAIDALLERPAGWFERHAGIRERRVWADQDPLAAAAEAARECLTRAEVLSEEVGALLVTSEAPPLLGGLAAALHHRLDLRPDTVALEVGNACTGFLAAVWLGRRLVVQLGSVLVIAVEAPSRYLHVGPGRPGETAALFGDAVAACVLRDATAGTGAVPLTDIVLGVDGASGGLIRVEPSSSGRLELHLEGEALASRAVHTMADAVRELTGRHGLSAEHLRAVIAHGGNGRLPEMLARRLGLPPERVRSATPWTGNLGSASLPAAWALHPPAAAGPAAWVTVGAGLTWAAMLTQ